MIKIKITGGLGNQMFQYAFGKALSLKSKTELKLDISGFEKYKLHKYCLEFFNIEKKYTNKNEVPFYENIPSNNKIIVIIKGILKRINNKHFIEKKREYEGHLTKINKGYIEGFFQTEKYFIDYEEEIRKSFQFKIDPSKKNSDILNIIKSNNSISVHIRRGDYVTNKISNKKHGICSKDYYENAFNYIYINIENPIFFFFSDDIEWVKNNIKVKGKSYYVDFNNADNNYEDLRLMSSCKHNIIANSSFSWWGAWLNNNKNKIIIAPKRWSIDESPDRIPNSWITL